MTLSWPAYDVTLSSGGKPGVRYPDRVDWSREFWSNSRFSIRQGRTLAWILRTWNCQNRRCGAAFDSGDPNPPCPKCGCARVSWQPGGGHIHSATTAHNDRTLKSVADRFGLTDMGQHGGTHAGERAEPNRRSPPRTLPYTPAPGFKVPFAENGRPTAGWADAPYPLKGTLPVNSHKFKNQRGRIPTEIVKSAPPPKGGWT